MSYGASYAPNSLVGQAKDVFSNRQVYKLVSLSNSSRRTSSRAVRFCVCGLKPTQVGRFVPLLSSLGQTMPLTWFCR